MCKVLPREKRKNFRKLSAFQTGKRLSLMSACCASLEKEEEYRVGKSYCVDDSTQTNPREEYHKNRRGCWLSELSRFEKANKQSWQKTRGRELKKRKNKKKRTKKALMMNCCERAVFFSKKVFFSVLLCSLSLRSFLIFPKEARDNTERVIKRVLSARSFEEDEEDKEREVRESLSLLFSSQKSARLGDLCSRERD
jgi:hypothetical protein